MLTQYTAKRFLAATFEYLLNTSCAQIRSPNKFSAMSHVLLKGRNLLDFSLEADSDFFVVCKLHCFEM